jgi:hypothetical protein
MRKRLLGLAIIVLLGASWAGWPRPTVSKLFALEDTLRYRIVSYTPSDSTDRGILTMQREPRIKMWFLLENVVGFNFPDWTNNTQIEEYTSINESDRSVGFHSPRTGPFYFAAILPFPAISLPPNVGNSSSGELVVGKATFEKLNGKRVRQSTAVTERKPYIFRGQKTEVFVTEGKNDSFIKELGQYHCTYWYAERWGFVRLDYRKPDGSGICLVRQ